MLFTMRVIHVTPCAQHLQKYEYQKLQNKMKGDLEDSTVQGSKTEKLSWYIENPEENKKKRSSKVEIDWYTIWK